MHIVSFGYRVRFSTKSVATFIPFGRRRRVRARRRRRPRPTAERWRMASGNNPPARLQPLPAVFVGGVVPSIPRRGGFGRTCGTPYSCSRVVVTCRVVSFCQPAAHVSSSGNRSVL